MGSWQSRRPTRPGPILCAEQERKEETAPGGAQPVASGPHSQVRRGLGSQDCSSTASAAPGGVWFIFSGNVFLKNRTFYKGSSSTKSRSRSRSGRETWTRNSDLSVAGRARLPGAGTSRGAEGHWRRLGCRCHGLGPGSSLVSPWSATSHCCQVSPCLQPDWAARCPEIKPELLTIDP